VEVAGLILGIIGTVTGLGALAWQVTVWRRDGPVVALAAARASYSSGMIEVKAVNSGRGPVTVERLDVPLRDGRAWPILEKITDQHLPHRLEPAASATWDIDGRKIGMMLQNISREHVDPDQPVMIRAVLGNGKPVTVEITALLPPAGRQDPSGTETPVP
jgi:hypothetical protein